MASEKSRVLDDQPADLLPILKRSGVLTERQFQDVRQRVLEGAYPNDARDLALRLVREKVLTEYQARRLLSNRPQGLIVGRYVVMDRIGSGAMGRVYKAHHQLMDRVVALKIIAPEIVSNERVVARFQREMKLVGRLDHPNVVRAFDADQMGTVLYIVMEFVSGRSLGQKFKDEGVMAPLEVAGYAAQAARGLAHAHEQGIVHRDVKPSNLLLSDTGQVKVLDLGLGVLMEADEQATFATADGIAVGTVDYMSPEQACGKDVDGRSDLYNLGCSMYHLMTGKLPFPGASPVERLGKRISGKPIPITDVKPDIPSGLVAVLERMMAAKPADRYATAQEAAEALERLTKTKGASGAPSRSASRPPSRNAMPAAPPVAQRDPEPAAMPVMISTAPPARPAAPAPNFPGWFRPLARLAANSPTGALVILLAGLLLAFGAGIGVGMIVK